MVSSFFRAIAEWMDPLHAADGRIGASHDLLGWDQMETVTVQCCRYELLLFRLKFKLSKRTGLFSRILLHLWVQVFGLFQLFSFPFDIAPLLPLPSPFFPSRFLHNSMPSIQSIETTLSSNTPSRQQLYWRS